MQRILGTAIIIFTALLALTGCITYDQDLFIADNGSGGAKVHYSVMTIDTGVESETDVGIVPESFSIDEAEIREMYRSKEIDLKGIKVKTGEAVTDVYLVIEFKNVLDLNGHGVWDENQVIGTRIEDGKLVFIQDITNPDPKTLTPEEKSMYDAYSFTYSLTMPNKIIKTNGVVGKDSRTVYWEYPLSVVESNPHLQMHASCKAPPGYKSNRSGGATGVLGGTGFFFAIGCCVIIFIILVVILLIVLLKRKKKPTIPQTSSKQTDLTQPATPLITEKPKPDVAPIVEETKTEKKPGNETAVKPDIVEEGKTEEASKTEGAKPPVQEAEREAQKSKSETEIIKREKTDESFD